MNHRFPTITHIMDILPYVEGREDMVVESGMGSPSSIT